MVTYTLHCAHCHSRAIRYAWDRWRCEICKQTFPAEQVVREGKRKRMFTRELYAEKLRDAGL